MKNQITRWNPLRQLEQMQNRLASSWPFDPFANAGKGESVTFAEWSPRVDVIENEKEFLIKAELPEMKREDVNVSVEDGVLTVSGERKLEKEDKGKKFHRIEREYGSFVRSFTLPSGTSGKKITAEFKDGVLKVHLPKDKKALSGKAIEIKAG